MAINYNPFSQFNVEPSSFSLPAGMDMNQAATMNAMMQPVSLLGQQGVSAPQSNFRPVTEADLVGTDGMSASQIVDMLNQPDYQTPSLASDDSGRFSLSQFLLPGIMRGGAPAVVPYSGGSLAPTGQIVPSFTRPMINVTGSVPQLSLPGPTAATAGAAGLSRLGPYGMALGGGYLAGTALDKMFGISDKLSDRIINLMGMDVDQPAFTNAGTLEELAAINQQNNAMSAPVFRNRDPIRATYQLGPDYNNETIMERESGEIFAPSASQLEAFMDGMESMSQPTATGIGLGGSEGVVFGGGQPPMTQDETRAMLQERFGAPTISAIQNLPSGQGMGMMTDAQGRMISQGDDRSVFDQLSQDRIDRIDARDVRLGETLTERDTRIADSRTEGTDRGEEMTFEEARKFVPKGQKETTKAYNERIKAFRTEQNSRLNKLKENLQELKVTGQELNNDRVRGLIVKYARSEPKRYGQVLAEAQAMFADGRIKDETEMALYIIEEMGDDVSSVTDKSDGSKSSMIDQVIQAGQGGSPSPQKSLDDQAYDYAINNPNDPRSQEILNRLGRK
jgi:hypothetical protein